MIQQSDTYPAYRGIGVERKAMISMTYEQLIEVANVLLHFDEKVASWPRLLGGVKLTERQRILHKQIHDGVINCALSLEEHEANSKGERRD